LSRLHLIIISLFIFSCSLWEYDDISNPIDPHTPNTYLSLTASDTVFASVDSITGQPIYAILETPDPEFVWDTLTHAFTTITTSKQELHWWGEDEDGEIIGYYYKWNVDSAWSFTTNESGLFYVPIRSDLDVFSFEIKAVDNDTLIDPTPATIVLPIRNSKPTIDFRFQSNPSLDDIGGDTSFTFPTRTFFWDVQDQDGVETITDIFYALDDTCSTCWEQLSAAAYSSLTLTELEPGNHTFYVKARDIAGAESEIIQFPDIDNPSEPNYWKVLPVQGDILLVDDFSLDSDNDALYWYKSVLDTLTGNNNYSVWEIGKTLPYSSNDVLANLSYFSKIIWFSAYLGNETYDEAEQSIYSYVISGGNIFINATEIRSNTFLPFPINNTFLLNPDGRMLSGKTIESTISSDFNIVTSTLISVSIKSFTPDSSKFYNINSLYNLSEPGSGDSWTGKPNVCSIGQFQVSPTQLSGKVVFMSIPLHNGSRPIMETDGSVETFLDYLLNIEFQ